MFAYTDKIFRTTFPIAPRNCIVGHDDTLLFIGSCFADSISSKLQSGLLDCYANPYGTVYNPASIQSQLHRIIDMTPCSDDEIVTDSNGIWHSYMAHTKIFGQTPEELKVAVDAQTKIAHAALEKACMVVITLGTAYVYYLLSNNAVVANCLKRPDKLFRRSLLSYDETVSIVRDIAESIHGFNPRARVVFTVSPVRHLKDTMHGNQLSKSTLLLAVDSVMSQINHGDADVFADYFEAYEILMDDLRDYRFYADDMVHPSDAAVEYIYERFAYRYFSDSTIAYVNEALKLSAAAKHRPMGDASSYAAFVDSLSNDVDGFRVRYKVNENVHTFAHLVKTLNDIKISLKTG